MRKLLVPIACLLTVLAVACSGDSESAPSASSTARAEVTATPATTATVAPTATPEPPTATSEPPTPEPTPEPPTPEPPPAAAAPPVGQPAPNNPPPRPNNPPPAPAGPVSATITASGLAFTTRQINARSGASVTVTLNNQDSFVPHDVSISGVASIASCVGPCSASVTFTAPGPGTYKFLCTIHPDMTGSLVVSP